MLNGLCTLRELNSALQKVGRPSSERDGICHSILEHLSDEGQGILLHKVWEEGVLPLSWIESIIISIWKPGMGP